jgi:hypothetical protein
MMYQEPIDMITRMIRVPLETKSPCFQRASRPYGFSMVSFSLEAWGGAGGLRRVGGGRLRVGRGGEHQRRCRRPGENDGREQRGQSADQVHVNSSKISW